MTEIVSVAGDIFGDGGICVDNKELCASEMTEVEGTADETSDIDEMRDDKIDVTADGGPVAVTVFVATCVDECDPISRYFV